MSKKKVLFIDRDGTLIAEPPDEQIDSLEKLEFIPGVFQGLARIARSEKYELVMVTNQDGLGTDKFPESTFWPAHEKMMTALKNEGIHFKEVHIDRSTPAEGKNTRKPGTGMLTSYFTPDYDLAGSYVIGDRLTDIELARNLGARGILIAPESLAEPLAKAGLRPFCALHTMDWNAIATFTLQGVRSVTHRRMTNETDISITLNLDGRSQGDIHTGLGFLDHMLDQLVRHGRLDLSVQVKGDLHIDEHHTMEDTALALGEAVSLALGDKRGISRYGFCLPMDDAQARVAVDFGGRPWLVWEAEFKREKVGDVPTEMFMHFFKSFSDAARCNLHIHAEGQNEHHKIESIFKAFARALRMAVTDEGTGMLPSTKGTI